MNIAKSFFQSTDFVKGQVYPAKGGTFHTGEDGVRYSHEHRSRKGSGSVEGGTPMTFIGRLEPKARGEEASHALHFKDAQGNDWHMHPNHLAVLSRYNDQRKDKSNVLKLIQTGAALVEDDETKELREMLVQQEKELKELANAEAIARQKAELKAKLDSIRAQKEALLLKQGSKERTADDVIDAFIAEEAAAKQEEQG